MRVRWILLPCLLVLFGCRIWSEELLADKKYPSVIQCQKGCLTLISQGHGHVTLAQKKKIKRFLNTDHRRPVLLSPCYQQEDPAWTRVVINEVTDIGPEVRVVQETQTVHPVHGSCVQLLAGPLRVHPTTCTPFSAVDQRNVQEFGCHTEYWRVRTIADPYDFFVQSGLQGDKE